jgi:hypothetical protein
MGDPLFSKASFLFIENEMYWSFKSWFIYTFDLILNLHLLEVVKNAAPCTSSCNLAAKTN